jgi:hypothetical protein
MKKTIRYCSAALFVAVWLSANAVFAQVQSTTTTTTSGGTITEFTPRTFSIRTTTAATPVRYTYTRSTTYVDENGNPVSTETVRSGAPVTVYYDRNGDQMVATRVVVHTTTQPDGTVIVHKKTTTTTTETKGEE